MCVRVCMLRAYQNGGLTPLPTVAGFIACFILFVEEIKPLS